MNLWTALETLAWALSALFGAVMVYEALRADTRYDKDLLTSSREGEIEALPEHDHEGRAAP